MDSQTAVGLLQLPDHLLMLCMPPWQKQLLSVCQRFRDILLQADNTSPKGKSARLLVPCSGVPVARIISLVPSVTRLQVLAQPGGLVQQLQDILCNAAAGTINSGVQLSPFPVLTGITHIQLTSYSALRVHVDQLLPDCLAAACPSLRLLELNGIWITQQQEQQPYQSLEHDGHHSQNSSHTAVAAASSVCHLHTLRVEHSRLTCSLEQLRSQLAGLQGLQALHWHVWCDSGAGTTPYFTAFPACLAACLTQLHLSVSSPQHTPTLFRHSYPVLRELQLCWPTLHDSCLAALLASAPRLTRLRVKDFALRTDFSSHACSWTDVGMCGVDVASLARLPLVGHVTQLVATSANATTITLAGCVDTCSSSSSSGGGNNSGTVDAADSNGGVGSAEEALALTAAAVAAAAASGGLQQHAGSAPCTYLHVGCHAPAYMHQHVLLATLPLLRAVTRLSLSEVHPVSCELLWALGHLPCLRELNLVYCSFKSVAAGGGEGSSTAAIGAAGFERDVWWAMAHSLVGVSELGLECLHTSSAPTAAHCSSVTLTNLFSMCYAAGQCRGSVLKLRLSQAHMVTLQQEEEQWQQDAGGSGPAAEGGGADAGDDDNWVAQAARADRRARLLSGALAAAARGWVDVVWA